MVRNGGETMSQKMKDGILIDNAVYMTDEKQIGFPLIMRIIQLVAIISGSFSVIKIFIDSFSLPVSSVMIFLLILAVSLLFFLLLLHPTYDWIKLSVVSLIYFLVMYRCFKQLENGFYLLENAMIERAGGYYNFPVFRYKAQYFTAKEDIMLLLVMIVIPIIALLALAIIRSKMVSLCYLILLLPVASSFLVGIIPSELYLLTYIITMLYLSRSYWAGHKSSFKDQKYLIYRVNSRTAIFLSIITLILFFLMKLFVPESQYDGIKSIDKTKVQIQDFMYSFTLEDISDKLHNIEFKLPNRGVGSGGLSSGELGKVDQINYRNIEHLRIDVPIRSITDGMFLKGYVGSVYTGSSWNGHSKATKESYKKLQKQFREDKFEPVNGSTVLLQNIALLKSSEEDIAPFGRRTANPVNKYNFEKAKIFIQYKAADQGYIFAPYHTDFAETGSVKYQDDLYVKPVSTVNRYEYEYFYDLRLEDYMKNLLNPQDQWFLDYSEDEKSYRNFVYEEYTRLPEEGLERLKTDFSKQMAWSQADNISDAISYVKNYLHSNTEYTLSPGKLPKGKDFVEYFLYENKVGYCTHYASAAALMLRSMGYPARYVEGYSVGPSDVLFDRSMEERLITEYTDLQVVEDYDQYVELSVRDYNAHAWVEVYVDGCGWYPVEFTPGANIIGTGEVVENVARIGEDIKEKNEPEVSPTEVPVEPTPSQNEEESMEEPPTTPDEKDHQTKGPGNEEKTAEDKGEYSMRFLLITGGSLVLLWLVAYFTLIRRKKLKNYTDNYSKRALLIYEEIEKLLSLFGALPRRGECLEDSLEYVTQSCPYINPDTFMLCIEIVKKARFSREMINEQELKTVENFYHILSYDIYHNSSAIKKVYMRLIFSV